VGIVSEIAAGNDFTFLENVPDGVFTSAKALTLKSNADPLVKYQANTEVAVAAGKLAIANFNAEAAAIEIRELPVVVTEEAQVNDDAKHTDADA